MRRTSGGDADGSDLWRKLGSKDPFYYSYRVKEDNALTTRVLRESKLDDNWGSRPNRTRYVNATVPTLFGVSTFWNRGPDRSTQSLPVLWNATTEVTVAQPVVNTKCRWHYTEVRAETNISYFQDDGRSLDFLANLSTIVQQVSGPSEANIEEYDKVQFFPPVWMTSPELGSKSTIGVFLSWQQGSDNRSMPSSLPWILAEEDPVRTDNNLTVVICTLSPYWNTVNLQLTYDNGVITVQTDPLSMSTPFNPRFIAMNLTGVDAFQSAMFHRQIFSFSRAYDQLASAFAIAISAVPNRANGKKIDFKLSPDSNPSNTTSFKFTTTLYGYGYGTTSISIRLSMAVISIYCIITITYILYTLITGSISTAWNSGIELITLSLQSKKPGHLGNTSVGIESIHTLSQSVGIRVNTDSELELVFANDSDSGARDLRKIERNKAY